jgi:hypothetical protein
MHIAVLHLHVGAHGLQTLDVLVHGRGPMAQPPADSPALRQKGHQGPSTRMEARMVLTIS